MEHLSQALRQSVSQNKEMQECLLGTIDKMADGLIAENRQARSSIGKSCTGISVCDDNQREFVKADAFTKDLLAKTKDSKITDEKNSSLDLQNWTCLRVHVKFHSKTKGRKSESTDKSAIPYSLTKTPRTCRHLLLGKRFK